MLYVLRVGDEGIYVAGGTKDLKANAFSYHHDINCALVFVSSREALSFVERAAFENGKERGTMNTALNLVEVEEVYSTKYKEVRTL